MPLLHSLEPACLCQVSAFGLPLGHERLRDGSAGDKATPSDQPTLIAHVPALETTPVQKTLMPPVTEPNIESPDEFYEALIEAHRDLGIEQRHELNAKLALLLANHIGAFDVLKAALVAARSNTSREARLVAPSDRL